MIGQTLGRYRIVEKLGAGGMGEVYRAHDEQLERDVAIKVLLANTLADDHARRRFSKEAKTLSKLNHPNIAQIHDFGSQDGVDFLVMEQVPGESLKDKLDKGSLPEKELVRLGGQIADALGEAHEQGIVHRDLKPGNVKLTAKGQAKVLDFGIAKLLQAATEATTQTFTETHSLAGTLPYMAPEQLRGEEIDARSDLYSFGVMLYEMATARRPFEEKLSTALSDAILHQAPPAPRTVNRRAPAGLENVILKCLEKEPERRYQSAKEVRIDLERLGAGIPVAARPRPWTRRLVIVAVGVVVLGVAGYFVRQSFWPQATPPPGKVMLAVLPFDNLSGDPDQEYFSDGMTEEMIAQLGRLQPARLGVIARTSAMRYKGTDQAVDEIGRELGVDYILEGSVRRQADRVRITAQLIQVSDQTQLWAENYQQDMGDIFAVQSEVAERIASSLAVEVLPDQQARSIDPAAYEEYLRGVYFWHQRSPEGINKAVDHFRRAIELDPAYAEAYAYLADCYTNFRGEPKLGWDMIQKALELGDQVPEVRLMYARQGRGGDVGENFKRAVGLDPNSAAAHHAYASYLGWKGRPEEGLAEIQRAYELDPLSPIVNVTLASFLEEVGRPDEAIAQAKRTIELHPNLPLPYVLLGTIYEGQERYDEAIAEYKKAQLLGHWPVEIRGFLGHAYAESGQREEARKTINELKELSESKPGAFQQLALVYAALQDKDQTLYWLEKAIKAGRIDTNPAIDDRFAFVHSDPRFQELLPPGLRKK
jgi:TolB-like protein/Flp pilus assembly protein TadD/tRNA A-37 threonylcarbamoyl transferase component Bud32